VIESVSDLAPGILGFRASGKVTSAEYREMMEPIYATLERGEKLNIISSSQTTFTASTGARWCRT
jgi:hypothetical protein